MVHGLSLATITGRWLGVTPLVQVSDMGLDLSGNGLSETIYDEGHWDGICLHTTVCPLVWSRKDYITDILQIFVVISCCVGFFVLCGDDSWILVYWYTWHRSGLMDIFHFSLHWGHMAHWCHCHSLSHASVKSRLVLPFWYRLTRVVPDEELLNAGYIEGIWLICGTSVGNH